MAPSSPSFDNPPGSAGTSCAPPPDRGALRRQLIERRLAFVTSAAFEPARLALGARLRDILQSLEPACLGTYWALRGEFNAAALCVTPPPLAAALALPYARRMPREMHFRGWDGGAPTQFDECGLPAADGAPVVPDVVLVPCLGYTRAGWRLGYGGGYFDRWLGAHPHVTAVGVAWSSGEIAEADFTAAAHDRAMTLVVTERGIAG